MIDFAPARIFISYSRRDGAAAAGTLREVLEAEHFTVWQDIVALEGNIDWWSQIEEALRSKALQHFVLLVTPGALESAVVRREIRLARQEGKTVSPVKGPGLDLNTVPRWFGHVYDLDILDQRNALMRLLAGPSKQNRVPMMAPEPSADFVQRPHEFGALKAKLLNPQGDAVAITAALRGAGGYGKTTLGKALAHDPDIADAYFDGILWVELGEKPGNLLSIVSDLIETMTGERPGLENLNSSAAKLGEALGDRRILLIIDDAWREQDLRPFLQGGRNTTRLVTTRRDDILPLNAGRQPVDAMRGSEALALLAWGLPLDQAAAHEPTLQDLAARLGGWAQLLKLVNGFLCDRVVKNNEPLHQAIIGVNKRLDVKGLTAFDSKNEAGRANAIAKTVSVSLELLDASERVRFAELAVFPEDADIPIYVVFRLWRETGKLERIDTEDFLQRLQSLSLLLSLDLNQRHFRLHDTLRNYLRNQAGQEVLISLHKHLLKALDRYYEGNFDWQTMRYFSTFVPMHLAEAGQRKQLNALLLSPPWMQGKLSALRSPQSLISDYDRYAEDDFSRLIGRTLHLTAGITTRDQNQLLPQLLGRLISVDGDVASKFREEARQYMREHVRPAFLTLRTSLTPPAAETVRLEGHTNWVRALALLPNHRLASGSDDNTIRLWDLKTGAEIARFEGHLNHVCALSPLPDGRLASGSFDNTVKLWDLKSGADTNLSPRHAGWVNALALLPDGRLASGSSDRTIRLWDLESAMQTDLLEGHTEDVTALAVLSDGRLASGSYDETIRLWALTTGAENAVLEGHAAGVSALAALQDRRLASGSVDGTILIWDLKSSVEPIRLAGHERNVNGLIPLPGGRLASGSDDGTIRLWNLQTGAETALLKGYTNGVLAFALLSDGRLASGSYDNTIRLWDPKRDGEFSRLEGHGSSVMALALLPGRGLASGSHDNTIRLWDLKTCAEIARLEGHGSAVTALAPLSDGQLASASYDDTIRLWDLPGRAEIARIVGRGIRLALLSDELLASSSLGGTIRLWNLKKGAESSRLVGHRKAAHALALLLDGRLASGSDDNTIRLWDLKTGAETSRLEGHLDGVRALEQLPNGTLVSGSWDHSIRLWDLTTGAETSLLKGHVAGVNALALLPNHRLASGSDDNTIRLWDPKSGAEITRLEVDAAVNCLAALPDGRLVAGDALGRLHWLEILD